MSGNQQSDRQYNVSIRSFKSSEHVNENRSGPYTMVSAT